MSYSWMGWERSQESESMHDGLENINAPASEPNQSEGLESGAEDVSNGDASTNIQDAHSEDSRNGDEGTAGEESKKRLEAAVGEGEREDEPLNGGGESAGSRDAALETTSAADLALEKLNVKIDFHIGSITLPVQKLTSLAPGWTLSDLPHLTFPKIIAFSAGRAFAEGELIEIDGKIGFRITQVLI